MANKSKAMQETYVNFSKFSYDEKLGYLASNVNRINTDCVFYAKLLENYINQAKTDYVPFIETFTPNDIRKMMTYLHPDRCHGNTYNVITWLRNAFRLSQHNLRPVPKPRPTPVPKPRPAPTPKPRPTLAPNKTSGKSDPKKTSGNFEPKKTSGNFEPKKTSGNFEPKKTSGNFEPKKTSGNFEPKKTSGNFEPKKTSGKSEPKKTSNELVSDKTFRKLATNLKLNYLFINAMHFLNTHCEEYVKLLEIYINEVKTDYTPFISVFDETVINFMLDKLMSSSCPVLHTFTIRAWLKRALQALKQNVKKTSGKSQPKKTSGKSEPNKTSDKSEPKKTSGKLDPKKTSGKSGPKKTSGKSEPKKTSGKTEPKKTSGKSEPKKTSGKFEPKKTSGKSEPKKTSGKSEPKKTSGKSEPKKTSGKSEPKKTSGKSEPKKTSGKSEPKKPSGKSDPKKPSGKSDPKKPSGKSDPKKTSGNELVSNKTFVKLATNLKLNYLFLNAMQFLNTHCEEYVKLLEIYINEVKTNYIPFIEMFDETVINFILDKLMSSSCQGLPTFSIRIWLQRALQAFKQHVKETSGKSDPKKTSGKSEPKKTSGKSEPKKTSGKSDPKKTSGKSDPKKTSGKSDPKKSRINDGCFTEISNIEKLNYLHDHLNHMNVNCEFYAVLLEHYIYAVKTNYIPFKQTFNKTDVNNMLNYLNSDDK